MVRVLDLRVFLFCNQDNYVSVRFGLSFGDELAAALKGGDAISTTLINTVASNALKVNPLYLALAAGGVENPRILSLSNHQRSTGPDNHSGFVGRLL
jgi:hypothetical protein